MSTPQTTAEASQQATASTTQASPSAPVNPASSSSQSLQPAQTRQAAEEARKDRTLAEFMLMLDDYEPLIPNEVTDYYLQRVGFECEDVRLKRLLSLAAQKFVSDIAADAYQHARIRTNAQGGRARANQFPGSSKASPQIFQTSQIIDILVSALAEYGINARKPDFYL
ncbi:hypothetical protein ONZ45_g1726 [Pleurotus djamor]|nr:hypothetical protein ONZ45_g1726 [Pleurotus djamor]